MMTKSEKNHEWKIKKIEKIREIIHKHFVYAELIYDVRILGKKIESKIESKMAIPKS